MCFNGSDIIYKFDILGPSPKLLIFNNERYKSFLSSIISIIIIIFVIAISIIFLIQYFKYDSPIVSYSKANDQRTLRTINLKDSFLIFQMIDTTTYQRIDNSKVYFTAKYSEIHDDGFYNEFPLEVQPCEVGKNLNIKYQNYVESAYTFERNISDFYCLNIENKDVNLFYQPNFGNSYIRLLIKVTEENNIHPEKMQTLIVNENNLIDHNDKDAPMGEDFTYYFTNAFRSDEYTEINYNFQYIKYESDDGYFFRNSEETNGKYFSDMSFLSTKKEGNDFNEIGVIIFGMNKSNYDYYQRTYKRIQSLLAEIMSIISLILEVGQIIISFLCDKKISCELIRYLMSKEKKKNLTFKKNDIHKLTESQENYKVNSKEVKQSQINKSCKSWNILNEKELGKKTNSILFIGNEKNFCNFNIIRDKEFASINYFHIIKSYFCFKDKKTKLINCCHQIINDDICIENILERFYINETINNYLLNKKGKKIDYIKCDKFQLIEKCLDNINEEFVKDITNSNIKIDKTDLK